MKKFLLVLALCTSANAQPIALLPFDHILRYDELTKLLHVWADARPNLMQIESIGTTPEGRPIWFVTLTNKTTGAALEKPALVIDGNMHATEESGGDYWRVLPEGTMADYNGTTIADVPPREPLDFGANFPGDQGTAPVSKTAGPYPTSEPEVAAYVAAIARRPNIVAHVTCHTF